MNTINYVIAYNSVATRQKSWVVSVGVDPAAPDDDFSRTVRGSNRIKNAHQFTQEFAEQMLPKVREVHRDAWIERADGSRINPGEGHTDAL